MLASLVKGTDWAKITEYLSPVFFQIVPPLAMAKKLKEFATGYASANRFKSTCVKIDRALVQSDLGLRIYGNDNIPSADSGLKAGSGRSHGDVLLRLFFWQLFTLDEAILDLRSTAFPLKDDFNNWQPSPLMVTWDPAFIASIRRLYEGFYTSNDVLMDQALAELGITAGKSVLLQHFGVGQDSHQFSLRAFRATFHELFVTCKHARAKLPADFLAFGGLLACLYEHLETLGGTYDVRAAFFDVFKEAGAARKGDL